MDTELDDNNDAKSALYEIVKKQIISTIDGEANLLARLVTGLCLLHQSIDYFYWTGIYLVDPSKGDELVIGPYQGTLGCLRIPFGAGNVRGVCGAAAAARETIIVEDVHAFDGHIACDSQTQSEIVVPIFLPDGSLYGVLDIDSTQLGRFCNIDRTYLEAILRHIVI